MARRRFELATAGLDSTLQGVTTSPFQPQSFPSSTGLLVPLGFGGSTTPATQPRYLFCLATYTTTGPTWVRGIRQGATIGFNLSSVANLSYLIEMQIATPTFHFVDGNISWHLVKEPTTKDALQTKLTDAPSWKYYKSDQPAMLYETFTNTNVDPVTGAPVHYNLGLTAYTPPPIHVDWQPICGLGNFSDIRYPWVDPAAWQSLDDGGEVDGGWKISLYASVQQTNPATANTPTLPAANTFFPNGLPQEESFIASLTRFCVYTRVYGSLLVEIEVEDTRPEDSKIGRG